MHFVSSISERSTAGADVRDDVAPIHKNQIYATTRRYVAHGSGGVQCSLLTTHVGLYGSHPMYVTDTMADIALYTVRQKSTPPSFCQNFVKC